jgi:hypothetical protein
MTTTDHRNRPPSSVPEFVTIGKGEHARRVKSPDFSGARNERSHTMHKLSHKTEAPADATSPAEALVSFDRAELFLLERRKRKTPPSLGASAGSNR